MTNSTKYAVHPIILLIVIAGLSVSCAISLLLHNNEQQAIIREFQNDVDVRAASLYRELTINLEAIYALTVLFNRTQLPSFKQFSQEAGKILSRHKDIQALEWVPRVKHPERSRLESEQQAEFPNFVFTERAAQGNLIVARQRREYFPVFYVEPMIGNEPAFGFDLAASTSRKNILMQSMRTATPLATAGVTLAKEKKTSKAILAFLPVYYGNPTTLEHRERQLRGFVLGVYRVSDIFNSSALSKQALGIEMHLIDNTQPTEPATIHVHRSRTNSQALADIVYSVSLPELWGRRWSISALPTKSYVQSRSSPLAVVVLVGGIAFTTFIAFYISLTTRRTQVIEQIVEKRTKELNDANIKLEQLSQTDGLTGIPNRRHLDHVLEKEWARAIRNHTRLSFLLIDIDYFKQYNDSYGHQKGDECLKWVAQVLKSLAVRPGDIVARYGGEEFAIVMPETEHAQALGENCRTSIQNLGIEHCSSKISNVVTISLGLSSAQPRIGDKLPSLVEAADRALYKAKASGRNRLVIHNALKNKKAEHSKHCNQYD